MSIRGNIMVRGSLCAIYDSSEREQIANGTSRIKWQPRIHEARVFFQPGVSFAAQVPHGQETRSFVAAFALGDSGIRETDAIVVTRGLLAGEKFRVRNVRPVGSGSGALDPDHLQLELEKTTEVIG